MIAYWSWFSLADAEGTAEMHLAAGLAPAPSERGSSVSGRARNVSETLSEPTPGNSGRWEGSFRISLLKSARQRSRLDQCQRLALPAGRQS